MTEVNKELRMPRSGRPVKDYTGQRFGRLVAIRYVKTIGKNTYWLFQCDCGKQKEMRITTVKAGVAKSCGCYHADRVYRHGLVCEKLYRVWIGMRERCRNIKSPNFKHYGCRGIKVCDEWNDYLPFRQWALANGYSDNLTIDRIENDGNYEPENCQWLTRSENTRKEMANRRGETWIPRKQE